MLMLHACCPAFCSLYDCDFNQQLELGLSNGRQRTVFDVDSLDELIGEVLA